MIHFDYKNIPPKAPSYKGGYAELTLCNRCLRIALRREWNPLSQCPTCKSNPVFGHGRCIGKWKDTTPRIKWWNPGTWLSTKEGYWDVKGYGEECEQ